MCEKLKIRKTLLHITARLTLLDQKNKNGAKIGRDVRTKKAYCSSRQFSSHRWKATPRGAKQSHEESQN
jgi:hypothetical protein